MRLPVQPPVDPMQARDRGAGSYDTEDPDLGKHWLTTFEGAGLDGVIAKRLDGHYLPGKREMVEVKHKRDVDCAAIGYRIHKSREGVGLKILACRRFRHAVKFVRWRPDLKPASCTFSQLDVPLDYYLSDALEG